ncbi:MAG: polysaccharide biosynthesis tyrosine autokinase [Prevotella sp.]|nr:polysaccharide biosynthesis tyrosine autokinase [Prevotella sp.]
MENNNTQNKTVTVQEGSNTVNLKDLYSICLQNWWWFVVSVLVCLTIASYYLLTTPNTYSRKATVMIKEDNNRNTRTFASQLSNMGSMNMFNATSDVNNELICFQSPALILEVAKRLHMDYNYTRKGFFQDVTLYDTTLPVTVNIPGLLDSQGVTFTMTLKGSEVEISELESVRDGKKIESRETYKGTVGGNVKTPVGTIEVRPTAYFTPKTEKNEIQVTRYPLLVALGKCQSKLNISMSNKMSAVLDITCNDVNKRRAEDIINTLIAVYNEAWVKDKNQIAVATSNFIGERLKMIEQELGNVDNSISTYKSQNLMPDLAQTTSLAIQQATMSDNKAREYNNQLYMARYIKNALQSNGAKHSLMPANTGISDGAVERMLQSYNTMVLQRNSLVTNSSESNPLVQDLDKQLESMKASIISGLNNTITNLSTLLRSEQGNAAQNTGKIAQSPVQAKNLLSIERQQKIKENLYLYLLQKREENELSQAFTAYNTRIITPPMGGNAATSPQKGKILGIALILGLLIPVAILYIREMLNTTVRGRRDLEALTVPYIGEIPQYQTKEMMKKHRFSWFRRVDNSLGYKILVKPRSRNIINEAFRVIRTNLEFMINSTGKDTKVIMATSFNPGSGKTFLLSNIAASFAIKDKKVVVIDLDLRRSSMGEYVGNPSKGIADYLAYKTDECPVVPVQGTDNMSIIPVGSIPPNPTELLYNERLEELIAKLRKEYDYVFIDCPPVDIVADTTIISKWTDMSIFVIRAELLEREMLPMIQSYYDDKKFNNMTILLNGTSNGHGRYGYHYGYSRYGSQGYGYGSSNGYGYAVEDDEE